ncbi:predicted protein [Plenodomus lingam JN3]|uniref:Predicted protein n=1 Tax=Leptosphaeria maculans (strain JN3 / isolate v23.1.3 / race Av1-4-5-6-7-8) TaxID=985895 RepID=E4ZN26_LEPMJ|nr:predicted protein [Plenodomus lingam JN3]CBX92629.1 predicted protein [Plenodomus lingam JN3]
MAWEAIITTFVVLIQPFMPSYRRYRTSASGNPIGLFISHAHAMQTHPQSHVPFSPMRVDKNHTRGGHTAARKRKHTRQPVFHIPQYNTSYAR